MKRDIKKEILTVLLKSDQLKYSALRPEGVDNDLFNYHLQQLVKQGFVEKVDGLYSLSSFGKYDVAEQNPLSPSGKSVDRFKLNVLTVVLRAGDHGQEVLVQKRARHPFFGRVGVMGGTIKKGELVNVAAQRKLKVETGLEADFALCGLLRAINLDAQGVLVTEDILFHVCCADHYQGKLLAETEYGENYWMSLEQAIELHEQNPGALGLLADFLRALQRQDFRTLPLFYKEQKRLVEEF